MDTKKYRAILVSTRDLFSFTTPQVHENEHTDSDLDSDGLYVPGNADILPLRNVEKDSYSQSKDDEFLSEALTVPTIRLTLSHLPNYDPNALDIRPSNYSKYDDDSSDDEESIIRRQRQRVKRIEIDEEEQDDGFEADTEQPEPITYIRKKIVSPCPWLNIKVHNLLGLT